MPQNDVTKTIEAINKILSDNTEPMTRSQIYEKLIYIGNIKPNTRKEFDDIIKIGLNHNEIDKDKLKSTRVKSKRLPNVLRLQQLKKIINIIDNPRDMFVLLTAWFTGCRRKEITRLKKTDLFLDDPKATYLKIIQGKRSKDRFITLPRTYVELLRLWLEYTAEYESPYLIPTDSSMKPIDDGYLNSRFQQACAKVGVLKLEYVDKIGKKRYNFHLHSMRHSYATFRLERGDSPQNVMEELGHKDVETLQIYSHISLEARQQHTNKVYGYGRELPNLIDVPRQESKAFDYDNGQLELTKRQQEIELKRLELEKMKIMRDMPFQLDHKRQ